MILVLKNKTKSSIYQASFVCATQKQDQVKKKRNSKKNDIM